MKRLSIATSILIALQAPSAFAEEESKEGNGTPNFAEETLTGDWGGWRTNAARNGYTFEGNLKVDTLHNNGAIKSGTKSVSHLDLKLGIDLEKAFGWTGGSALINVLQNAGRGLNYERNPYVGNFMGATNIEVGAPTTTRLFQAWVQQSLFDDQLAILAGLYPIDSEFFTVESAGVFLGPQYGTPADLALTRGPSIFNSTSFGIRALWNINKTVYAMGAVLDGIPNDPDHPKETRVRFQDGDGTFQIVELGWKPEAENESFKGHAKFALGLWNYTAHEDHLDDTALIGAGLIAGPARNDRQTGGYVLGERTLFNFDESGERFLTGFARYTWGDARSYEVKNTLNLGLHAKGPFAARPDDILGLAWTRAGLSSEWRDAEMIANGNRTDDHESALELTYRAQITPYLAIQPNAQWISNPGGIKGADDAKLIGVRFDLAL